MPAGMSHIRARPTGLRGFPGLAGCGRGPRNGIPADGRPAAGPMSGRAQVVRSARSYGPSVVRAR